MFHQNSQSTTDLHCEVCKHAKHLLGKKERDGETCIQLFRERLSETNVHATIPKGNMGYEQDTVPDSAAVKPTFVTFL